MKSSGIVTNLVRGVQATTIVEAVGPIETNSPVNEYPHHHRVNRKVLLGLAAVLHLCCTILVFLAGRLQLVPSLLDRNGVSISFAQDSQRHWMDATQLAHLLREDGFKAWLGSQFPSHSKIYSITLAILEPAMGSNILAAEPINLFCYVAILWLIYELGNRFFSKPVGLIAAVVIAIWPTFLLHTTQFLKDPIFIAAMLGLFLSVCQLLRGTSIWIFGVAAAGVVLVLWIIRADLWMLYLTIILLGLLILLLRGFNDRKLPIRELLVTVFLIFEIFAVPRLISPFRNPTHPLLKSDWPTSTEKTRFESPKPAPPSPAASWLTQVRETIVWTRYRFTRYPARGSNIDDDVQLDSWGAVLRYVPRAMVVGFFAPFPNMWLVSGSQVGLLGRVLAGIEMSFIYSGHLLAMFGLWRRRNYLISWFLVTVVVSCVTALAFIIPNVGALYRFRYVFFMLVIIMAVDSALQLCFRNVRPPLGR